MLLSIIIPCRDEADSILETVNYITEELNHINHELILINDFSKDSTLNILEDISKSKSNIYAYDNNIRGLGGAIEIGIKKSNGKYTAIMMADLSDNVSDLKNYIEIAKKDESLDAVFGSRFKKESRVYNYPLKKLFLNRLFNYFVKIIFFSNYNDFTNAFKLYKKDALLELFPIVSENFNIFLELPLKIISRGFKYQTISISWNNRKKGKSKFNVKELSSKYFFTLAYCFMEKHLLRKKKLK
jgi:dolichol-phosphate mannosyltransferase